MLEWLDWSIYPKAAEVKYAECFYRKDHFAILSNGEVVLCSLDFNGHTTIGNVNDTTLSSIINGDKARKVFSEFEQGQLALPYCRKCMANWQAIPKALGLGTATIAAQQAILTTLRNECSIW
jgi:radical SAM protein with 4Fe4S-binding SPASM domain